MIPLEDYLTILERASTGAGGLQLLGEMAQVEALLVDALDDGDRPPPLPRLHINPYTLLLLANSSTDTYVRGKSALRTDLGH